MIIFSLYSAFKDWHKNNNPNTRIPDNRTFLKEIKKYKNIEKNIRVGKKVSYGIKNITLKDEDNEI